MMVMIKTVVIMTANESAYIVIEFAWIFESMNQTHFWAWLTACLFVCLFVKWVGVWWYVVGELLDDGCVNRQVLCVVIVADVSVDL